ncbi:class I SAM-dependent methyltransferase [Actinomycetospora cinnamomea]|uniref:Methyltransferase family protein n=1 Tax=Actinomycetospora cinnamomea TaxID=663609 RepID=A0A2U1F8H4_9PSEU|nr:methyltransferase [Actinomycetospora cinnamomea]PVZ08439.1 methyltransferase family protein [Actinomycetospora cinnamomea]
MTDQYFSEQPTSASDPVSFRLEIGDVALDLTTDAGVFSRGRLDKGTRVLLQNAPEPAEGDLLDLGCGYGPIALWLAVRRPASTVWAVDVNDRALELVRANAAAARVGNVRACRPDEVPADVRFAQMWSNPPIRSGKAALHELLLRWLPRVDGTSYLVVSKNLGSDSLARWLGEQGHPTSRLSSHAGFRVLAVDRSESVT